MREYEGSIGKVTYPDEIVFAFNPCVVTVETDKDVTFTIGTLTDVREPMGGKVEIDISKYLQAMVSKEERHKNMSVALGTVDGDFLFYLSVVWGAINVGERFNGDYALRWWKGLPFTMEVYIPSGVASVRSRYDKQGYAEAELSGWVSVNPEEMWPDATDVLVVRVDDGDTASVFDYTFDHTFTGVGRELVHLYRLEVWPKNDCGVYLRWIDRHGWLRYWLFDKGQESMEAKPKEAVRGVWDRYRVSRYTGKTVARSVKLCAPMVTDDELEMLEHLGTSAVVDMWTGSEWLPVNIEAVTVTRGGRDYKPLNDYECVMSYPEVMAQRL